MTAKFEEKTYESFFNAELDRHTELFYPPGQVQEGFLGFDSSGFSRSRMLWSRFGVPRSAYPYLDGVQLDHLEHYMGALISDLPPFKVNLLFQFKRPEYISRASGSEWSHWGKPYYRYHIYQHQQQLLNLIHQEYNAEVLTLYASPAIHEIKDLMLKQISRQIIEYSNFQHCHLLNGHHRNTYIGAGMHSIACSEPEKLEGLNLLYNYQN